MHVPPFSLSQQITDLGPNLEQAVLNVLRSGQYIGGHRSARLSKLLPTMSARATPLAATAELMR